MGSKPSPPPAHWRGKRKNYTTKQLQTLGTEQSLFQANCMKDVNPSTCVILPKYPILGA